MNTIQSPALALFDARNPEKLIAPSEPEEFRKVRISQEEESPSHCLADLCESGERGSGVQKGGGKGLRDVVQLIHVVAMELANMKDVKCHRRTLSED